jgi:hypothetical protein
MTEGVTDEWGRKPALHYFRALQQHIRYLRAPGLDFA